MVHDQKHAESDAELGPLPNYDLGAVPNGALQGPPTQSLPLIEFAAMTRHSCLRAKDEAAVAAMQGASEAEPVPLLVGTPAVRHHEAAVAAMTRATPGQGRSIVQSRTLP